MQQTPNPSAQVPELAPPLAAHSTPEKQVPFLLVPEQASFCKALAVTTVHTRAPHFFLDWVCTQKCIFLSKRLREYRLLVPSGRWGGFTHPLMDNFALEYST